MSDIARFPSKEFSLKFIRLTSRMRYELCKLGFDRSLIKGTLLEEQIDLSAVFRISLEGFS